MHRPLLLCCILVSACFVDAHPELDAADADTGGDTALATTGTSADGSTSLAPMDTTGAVVGSTGDDSGTSTTTDATDATDGADSDSSGETTEGMGDSSDSSSSGDDDTLYVEMLVRGDLVITEVMGNPNCTNDDCEWFELYNATEFPIDLHGLGVGNRSDGRSGSPDAFVTESAIVMPGTVEVLALENLWPYAGAPLTTYSDDVRFGNTIFEQVYIFGFNDLILDESLQFSSDPDVSGRSRVLLPEFWDVDANDDSDHWCISDSPLPSASTSDDWGTPGSPDVLCLP